MDHGIIVDVETTGLDSDRDQVIEIGVLGFCLQQDLKVVITDMYGGLEDPRRPLDAEITKLTGLTNECLEGQSIQWDLVRSMFDRASLVIAHNANFDAQFLKKHPKMQGIQSHWACSIKHIDWEALGMPSRKLNYLAADHGFVNPFAHRALFDCATTFRLVAPHLQQLIERSWMKEWELAAMGAPFETKDLLREKGYRWDQQQRVWKKSVLEDSLLRERQFLTEHIYRGQEGLHQESEVVGLNE